MRRPFFHERWDRTPREEILRWQGTRLADYLREEVAAYSPFYRDLFSKHKVDVRKIRSVADLRHLPLVSKADIVPTAEEPRRPTRLVLAPDEATLRAHAPPDRLAGLFLTRLFLGAGEVERRLGEEYRPSFLTFTTGRSAMPTPFLYSSHDLSILEEIGRRIGAVVGLDPKIDRGVNLFPFAPHLAFWQTYHCGTACGVLLLHTGGGKVMGTAGCLSAIERLKPTILMGVPGYLYHVLREAHARGMDLSAVRLVFLGGERASPEYRSRVKQLLAERGAGKVGVFSVFGFTESRSCWPECAGGDATGFHLYPDLGIVEMVDPKSGEPVPDGSTGELVFTSLGWRGSALVRYRTGDIVEGGITWEPCPSCGRTCPRIGGTIRRVSNVSEFRFSKVRGTLVDFNQIAEFLSSEPRIEEWQITVQKPKDDPFELDEMVLSVALREGPDSVDAWIRSLESRFAARCEVAPSRVEVVPLAEMTKRLGMEDRLKEQRIVDRRPKSS